jgi:3',5'-cyclic AMP phosphodiesterase CpdA
MSQWSFAIISDVHVYKSGQVPARFATVVARLCELAPRLVVFAGDATVGNDDDGVPADTARGWWQSFRGALQPLHDAGISVLPIAGNHDYYTAVHRAAYRAAWPDLAAEIDGVVPLCAGGDPPLYYSCDLDGVHLSLLHVVDQKIEPAVEQWLRADLAAAAGAGLRLCIGHVPLVSMMGHSSDSYRDQLGAILIEGQVAAYFSGHEHLVWDQELRLPGGTLRQIHVGTASGTYHFPLSQGTYAAHCSGDRCTWRTWPSTGAGFALAPGSHQQADAVSLCVVDIDGTDYSVRHLALRDEQLVPFAP